MAKFFTLLFFTSLLLITFTSCHTSKRQAVVHRNSRQPKFIGDIYMNGHNKSSTTTDAIKPAAKPTAKNEKSRHTRHEQTEQEQEPPAISGRETVTTRRAADKAEEDSKPVPRSIKKKYADIIGVKAKEIDNFPLYNFIDRWYGTNYRLGGQDESGIDCSGFAQKLYEEVYGVDLLRTAMDQFKNCKRIKRSDDAEEGDLVFFKQRSKRITHVGVYLGNDFFVHASSSQGVVISSLKEEYWHKHYAGIGRIHKERG